MDHPHSLSLSDALADWSDALARVQRLTPLFSRTLSEPMGEEQVARIRSWFKSYAILARLERRMWHWKDAPDDQWSALLGNCSRATRIAVSRLRSHWSFFPVDPGPTDPGPADPEPTHQPMCHPQTSMADRTGWSKLLFVPFAVTAWSGERVQPEVIGRCVQMFQSRVAQVHAGIARMNRLLDVEDRIGPDNRLSIQTSEPLDSLAMASMVPDQLLQADWSTQEMPVLSVVNGVCAGVLRIRTTSSGTAANSYAWLTIVNDLIEAAFSDSWPPLAQSGLGEVAKDWWVGPAVSVWDAQAISYLSRWRLWTYAMVSQPLSPAETIQGRLDVIRGPSNQLMGLAGEVMVTSLSGKTRSRSQHLLPLPMETETETLSLIDPPLDADSLLSQAVSSWLAHDNPRFSWRVRQVSATPGSPSDWWSETRPSSDRVH